MSRGTHFFWPCIKVLKLSAAFIVLVACDSAQLKGAQHCFVNGTIRRNLAPIVTTYVKKMYGGWPWTDCAEAECRMVRNIRVHTINYV